MHSSNIVFLFTDVNMAAGRVKSFRRVGSLMRSKSEGTLIDLDDNATLTSNNFNGEVLILKHKTTCAVVL